MDAGHERVLYVGVTLAASGGNIELIDWRLLVVGLENVMGAVAIGADGSLRRALFDGATVHALLVGKEGLSALPIRLHEELLPVASTARGRDICVTYRRFGVIGSDNFV